MNGNRHILSNSGAGDMVLVVDDDQSVRKSVLRIMRTEKIAVRTFASAEALMKSELPGKPSCLLLDLHLPGMDGLELQLWLARECPAIQVLFMSGHADVRGAIVALKHGATDFLLKPFDSSALLASIREALQKARHSFRASALQSAVRSRYELLTPREKQVFELLVSGQLNKQVAFQLGTSEKTIKVHRARIKKKLQINSPLDLVRCADVLGIGIGSINNQTGERQ